MTRLTRVSYSSRYPPVKAAPVLLGLSGPHLSRSPNYLMVAAVFLARPYAYRQGANIRVTFL